MLSRIALCHFRSSPRLFESDAFRSNTFRAIRLFQNETKARANIFGRTKTVRQQTLKERLLQPTTGQPFLVGKAALAAGSVIGLASLCYYGAGLSSQDGAFDRSLGWPQYVRDRIHSTYMYFGGSLIFTAATAAAVLRNPMLMNYVTRSSLPAFFASIAAMMVSGILVQSIPYKPGFGAKQLAWMAHSAVIGTVIAPIALLGGPLMLRAALYTAGLVGGLSCVAACAPSDRFLNMAGPLAIGFGIVFASCIGTYFLPPTTAIGASLYSISVYGGLLLFSAFLLYDTQRIIRMAENYPIYGFVPYDPVNASLSIYINTINIFIRMAMILAGGGNRKR